MPNSILILCPSRDRNLALGRMIVTLLKTSTHADLAVYVDDDQVEMYAPCVKHERVRYVHGPRVGPVAAMNVMVETNPGYEVYGAVTDDSEFRTDGWDLWLLKAAASFPGGIGVMSPKLRGSKRMDYPYATRRWVEVLGFFAWPGCHHFYWDVLVELLGEGIGAIKYATEEEFLMLHDDAPTENISLKTVTDARNLLPIIAIERPLLIRKLREAVARAEVLA